jgi:SAM-dependent methyltransferase
MSGTPTTRGVTKYVDACARRITQLGERLGIDALIYNPGIFLWYHRRAVLDAPGVITTFEQQFPGARRIVDIGAGSGAFAAEAQRRGKSVIACEHSRFGRRLAGRQGVKSVEFDLARTPPATVAQPSDLAYCFEVAEHVPQSYSDNLVQFISRQAPLAVFTAAPPGQGGAGHINERPRDVWISLFAKYDMAYNETLSKAVSQGFVDNGVTSPWLGANVLVFERDQRKGRPGASTVAGS